MRETPELLAPAGSIEAGLTALDAGADADEGIDGPVDAGPPADEGAALTPTPDAAKGGVQPAEGCDCDAGDGAPVDAAVIALLLLGLLRPRRAR